MREKSEEREGNEEAVVDAKGIKRVRVAKIKEKWKWNKGKETERRGSSRYCAEKRSKKGAVREYISEGWLKAAGLGKP